MRVNHLPKIQIQLLGAPQIGCDGMAGMERMPAKAQALLYYLAMTGRAHTRVSLAALLWGEHGEEEARRNLRKVIQELRQRLAPYLAIDYHMVGFHSPSVYWVDAVEFAASVAEAQRAEPQQLQAALSLYRADFLEGFYVRAAPGFESWMLSERARLRELMLQCLAVLGERYAAAGDLPHAIASFRRLLELEPWREEAHRQLMLWLAQRGQRNAALVQYELCCRALAEELGVEPDEATRALHASLLQSVAPAAGQAPPAVQQAPQPPPQPLRQPPPAPAATVDYPLVGRQAQWQTLRAAWARAVESGAQMAFVAGEAGIGKTRLGEELLLHVQRQGHATARARAYALEGRLAYAPLADWLRTPPLQARLGSLDKVWLREVARLLPELLIEHPDLPAPEPLAERWQQKRLFEALRHAFTADSRPLLLLLDDLQWCDPETLAFLQYLLDTAPQAPLLVVGTVRSDEVDEDHPIHKLRRSLLRAGKLTTIDLSPLSAEETAALGAEAREYALDSVAATGLYQASAGNPLFIVEMVRAGDQFAQPSQDVDLPGGQATPPKPHAGLPPKVHAVIEARLAQLSPAARTLAQVAAIIGRAFTLPLLVEASREDEETVVHGLDELWRRRIVAEQGSARYDFTHDRIRDVAYAASSPVKRAHFHRRVAQALEKLHAADLDPIAGELAIHYQHAGAWEEAFTYFRRAAVVARRLYAHSEQLDYLQKAIAAAEVLPAHGAPAATRIELWHALGLARVLVYGWGSELAAEAWQNADDLAAKAGDLPQRCEALSGLATISQNRGQWHKARMFIELAVTLAQETPDEALLGKTAAEHGTILYHYGEFAAALSACRRHPYFSDTPVQMVQAWSNGELTSGLYLRVAKCLWLLGFPDQALACAGALLAVRQQFTKFFSFCAGLSFLACSTRFCAMRRRCRCWEKN